jgi:hypothetical protein
MIQPTNVANLRKLGVYDEASVDVSVGRLREVAERQGSAFLDLHDLLPGRSFSDEADHLFHDDKTVPAGEIASRILTWTLGDEDWGAQVTALPMVRAYRAEDAHGPPPP